MRTEFSIQNIISGRWRNPETDSYENKDLSAEIKMDIAAGNIIPNGFYISFMSIFGAGCRQKTKNALMAAFRDGFKKVKSAGLLERVIFYREIRNITNGIKNCSFEGVNYTAVQDYPEEIRDVRRIICENYL